MLNPLTHLPTHALLQSVRTLETRLIQEETSSDDVDQYVAIQLELARRMYTLESVLDPRD